MRLRRLGRGVDPDHAVGAAAGGEADHHAGLRAAGHRAQSATYTEQFNAWKLKHEATRRMAAKRYLLGTQQNDRASMNEALSVERATIERWQTDDMKVPKDRAPTQGECDRLVSGMGQLALPGAVKTP
jgi:hypothetical protein